MKAASEMTLPERFAAIATAFDTFGRALTEAFMPRLARFADEVGPLIWHVRNVNAYIAEPDLNDLRDAGLVL